MTGNTCVIVASGPSITAEDIETVRLSGLYTIAVNSSWKIAQFCSVLYAGDRKWWQAYGPEVKIKTKRVTHSKSAAQLYKLKHHKCTHKGWNSGALAIHYAADRFDKIILLGYDCSVKNGIHFHGAHTKTPNPDATKCNNWHGQFRQLSKECKADIVNCSKYTEIVSFRLGNLECELG